MLHQSGIAGCGCGHVIAVIIGEGGYPWRSAGAPPPPPSPARRRDLAALDRDALKQQRKDKFLSIGPPG